jgi:hypothetical protein
VGKLRGVIVLCGIGLLISGAACWSVGWLGLTAAGQEGGGGEQTTLERVVVTLTVGQGGEPLSEAVDVHLGVGFPLRLYPLGTDQRTPAFAAFPQKSSLKDGATSLQPGETATFEFAVNADGPGMDAFRSTPEMFRDLLRSDPQRSGFASLGKSDWIVQSFSIEINGRTVASGKDVNLRPQQVQRENQARLQEKTAELEAALSEVSRLEATALTGLATDDELEQLQTRQDELTTAADEVNRLAGVVNGALPWAESGNPPPDDAIQSIEVTLTPQDVPQSGSQNPLYLWIAGRKFALTSEADPLSGFPRPQTFGISPAELAANPVSRQRVNQIGIGMVPSEASPPGVPDRARLERVQVFLDGKPFYDSARVPADKDLLKRIALVPTVVRNKNGDYEPTGAGGPLVTLWKSGMPAPKGLPENPEFSQEPGPLDPGEEPFQSEPDPTTGEPTSFDPESGEPLVPDPEVPGALTLPPLPPPVLVLAPFDDSGLNSPRRRRARPRNKRTPIVINIPTPSVPSPRKGRRGKPGSTTPATAKNPAGTPGSNGSGPAAPRPVVPAPAPAAPVLSAIKVNPAIPILRDGDQSNVTWQVSGPTTTIASYRVDLFGVLPHNGTPLINTPLATLANVPPSGSASMLARMPAIQISKIQGQLPGASAQYLYVQPKVTALSSGGTAIVSGFGSILPLFPSTATSPHALAQFPGALVQNGAPVASARPPSFQILPAGAASLPWKSSPALDPATVSTSWPLSGEQDSSFALTFASYVPPGTQTPLPAYCVAVRPATNGERVSVQYEGALPIPSNLPTPVKGYRLVGHIAFLGGNAPATAAVQTRVNAFIRPNNPTPFFSLQTPAPITYTKFSSGTTPAPCLLIDMPIRYDLMRSNSLASSPHDASKYSIFSFLPGGPNGFSNVGNAGGGQLFYVQATFMIAMQATTTTDAVGIFGLRLVPDNN